MVGLCTSPGVVLCVYSQEAHQGGRNQQINQSKEITTSEQSEGMGEGEAWQKPGLRAWGQRVHGDMQVLRQEKAEGLSLALGAPGAGVRDLPSVMVLSLGWIQLQLPLVTSQKSLLLKMTTRELEVAFSPLHFLSLQLTSDSRHLSRKGQTSML